MRSDHHTRTARRDDTAAAPVEPEVYLSLGIIRIGQDQVRAVVGGSLAETRKTMRGSRSRASRRLKASGSLCGLADDHRAAGSRRDSLSRNHDRRSHPRRPRHPYLDR